MVTVGIRALKQNASAVVGEAAGGTVVTITDRGRPVAQLIPIPANRLSELMAAGLARSAKCSLGALGAPPEIEGDGRPLSEVVLELRASERY